jgi:valyl-tRNA synthetase
MGREPFKYVFIHGIVRDALGRKMSKSLGNGIDPLEVIEQYGTDALRFALTTGNSPGNDLRFSTEKVEAGRNFANKIWNATRFVLMNFDENIDFNRIDRAKFTTADKWILSRANIIAREVTENLENFELGIALQKIYEFIWEEFCDWYIEMAKPRLYKDDAAEKLPVLWTLRTVLSEALRLLHPFMPFITEEIYCTLNPDEETIMTAPWPEYTKEYEFPEDAEAIGLIKDAIRGVRNIRTELNVSPGKHLTHLYIVSGEERIRSMFDRGMTVLKGLAHADEALILRTREGIGDDALSAVLPGATLYIPFGDLVDRDKEIARLNKEKDRLAKEVKRCEGMLGNERFLAKAPAAKVQEEREKLGKYRQMLDQVGMRLAQLQK